MAGSEDVKNNAEKEEQSASSNIKLTPDRDEERSPLWESIITRPII